ncbi:uncharacterized protein LOC142539968 [Primulina tabacum]|uniref:uncharacterized protein LOC142539968 n=1 Tax=Primulina tabacum TaxID=48773 RepID=UPI003F597C1C
MTTTQVYLILKFNILGLSKSQDTWLLDNILSWKQLKVTRCLEQIAMDRCEFDQIIRMSLKSPAPSGSRIMKSHSPWGTSKNPVKFRLPTAGNLVPIIEIDGQRFRDAFIWNPSGVDETRFLEGGSRVINLTALPSLISFPSTKSLLAHPSTVSNF